MAHTEVLPITGLPQLHAHLCQLEADPTTPIQPKPFHDVQVQLTDENSPPLLQILLSRLEALLFTITTQESTPLLNLLTKLTDPIAFTEIVSLSTPPNLLDALRSPLPGANTFALSIIQKAAASVEDAKVLVQSEPEAVGGLITLWIGTEDTGVAERCAKVLLQLLEMDCPIVVPQAAAANGTSTGSSVTSISRQQSFRLSTPGNGLLWNLIFQNSDNLTRIVAHCSLSLPQTITSSLPPSSQFRSQRSVNLSQSRLLRILPPLLSMTITPLFADHTPLFRSFAYTSSNLLSWAALEMVDRSDLRMQLTLVNFFETLVNLARVSTHQPPIKDEFVKSLVRLAMRKDETGNLRRAMVSLPDRTVEEEADGLREYLRDVVGA